MLVNAVLSTIVYDKTKYQDVMIAVHLQRLFKSIVSTKKDTEQFITWKEFTDALISQTAIQDNNIVK